MRIIETDNKNTSGVNSYAAKVFVKNNDDNTSTINYKAGFYRESWVMIHLKN